jgi:hypothetical protein
MEFNTIDIFSNTNPDITRPTDPFKLKLRSLTKEGQTIFLNLINYTNITKFLTSNLNI